MSENRFWFVIDKGKLEYVQDNVANEKITVSELEDLLNELSTSCRQLDKEVKSLNAFLVHKGFAEEYILWKLEVDV